MLFAPRCNRGNRGLAKVCLAPARTADAVEMQGSPCLAGRGFSRRAAARGLFDEVVARKTSNTTSTAAFSGPRPRQNSRREATREKNHGLLGNRAASAEVVKPRYRGNMALVRQWNVAVACIGELARDSAIG